MNKNVEIPINQNFYFSETNNTDLMPIAYCFMLSPHPWQKITPRGKYLH